MSGKLRNWWNNLPDQGPMPKTISAQSTDPILVDPKNLGKDDIFQAGFDEFKWLLTNLLCDDISNQALEANNILQSMKLKNLAKFDEYNYIFESYMVAANKMHDLTTKQYYLNSLPCGLGAWAQDYIIRKEHKQLDDVSFPTIKRLIRYKLEKQCLLGALQLNKEEYNYTCNLK